MDGGRSARKASPIFVYVHILVASVRIALLRSGSADVVGPSPALCISELDLLLQHVVYLLGFLV